MFPSAPGLLTTSRPWAGGPHRRDRGLRAPAVALGPHSGRQGL